MEVPYASYQPGSTALTSPGSRRGDARTPEARLQITAAGGSRHRRDDPVRGRALDRDIGGEGSGVIEAAPASGPTRRGPRDTEQRSRGEPERAPRRGAGQRRLAGIEVPAACAAVEIQQVRRERGVARPTG